MWNSLILIHTPRFPVLMPLLILFLLLIYVWPMQPSRPCSHAFSTMGHSLCFQFKVIFLSFGTSIALSLFYTTYYVLPYILVICVHYFLPNDDCKILELKIQICILKRLCMGPGLEEAHFTSIHIPLDVT